AEVLRPQAAEGLDDREVHGAEERYAEAEEGMRAPRLLDAFAQSRRSHRPWASRRGSAGRTGAGFGATRGAGARSVRCRSPKARSAGSAKSAAERQVNSPSTAVRPKDWIAMLSAVTSVA